MAKKSKSTCTFYPEINGEDSQLYIDLLKMIGSRPLTNWVYANYQASNAKSTLIAQRKSLNYQGQHRAEDVYELFQINRLLNQSSSAAIETQEKNLGAIDAYGNRVDFTDGKKALEEADRFNDNHDSTVATVVQHGDVFNIIVNQKNSRTHMNGVRIKRLLEAWQVCEQTLNNTGVDINNAPSELKSMFTPYRSTSLPSDLRTLKNTDFAFLDKKGALALFFLFPNSRAVRNVITKFGSIDRAAAAVEDIAQGSTGYTADEERVLRRSIADCQRFDGINLDDLRNNVNQLVNDITVNSPENNIKKELRKLHKDFGIDALEFHKASKAIHSYTEAAEESVIILERQIRELRDKRGSTDEGKDLQRIQETLLKGLAERKVYLGIWEILQDASVKINDIDDIILSVPQTGTEVEIAFAKARAAQQVKSILKQYWTLIHALSKASTTVDTDIPQQDLDNIRQLAATLDEFMGAKEDEINAWGKSVMEPIVKSIVGETAPDGTSIANAIEMANVDMGMANYLYAMGRASNVTVAAMGTIIRDAQEARNEAFKDIVRRIRRITDRLYSAGHNSKFIYEDEGHIISDIDWNLYDTERNAFIKTLYRRGLTWSDFEFREELEDWEWDHTEDRVVNQKDGRTERVPNSNYRKEIPKDKNGVPLADNYLDAVLTPEQREYYDEMMQIKGEIGSLLPEYARHQYLPPQLRRKMMDALASAKSPRDVTRALGAKFVDALGLKLREDDQDYTKNGIIVDGTNYRLVRSDYDNEPLKQIPIFCINRVKDGYLMKDFSAGLQALAGTALNYNAMDEIVDVIEYMEDYVTDADRITEDPPEIDVAGNSEVRVYENLRKTAETTRTADLVHGWVMQNIYGERVKQKELEKRWWRIFNKSIMYTSVRGLATNVFGMAANIHAGLWQEMMEAGAGEFYNKKDFIKAWGNLFGVKGMAGSLMELWSNNRSHKATLLAEKFDVEQDFFSSESHKRYHKSAFRKLIGRDLTFMGYEAGEYFLHMLNMFAVLNHEKVYLNGKEISLYSAFTVGDKVDGNRDLVLKSGVTDEHGNPITEEYLEKVKGKIIYVNDSCHGAMNPESKGLIHRTCMGRAAMNFRQWMVEHYSRRVRESHFDFSLREHRTGMWKDAIYKHFFREDMRDKWRQGNYGNFLLNFAKDLLLFEFESSKRWKHLNDKQRYNVKRVRSEIRMFLILIGLSNAAGEPEDHKREFWRRWCIYMLKRQRMEAEAGIPNTKVLSSFLTIMQRPFANTQTWESLLYVIWGLEQDDWKKERNIQTGKHAGENRYLRNLKKYILPYFKDKERFENFAEDEGIFKLFDMSPGGR